MYAYLYDKMYFFICSILKHQLNINMLDENGTF